jgi:hypothetical protein
MGTNVCEESATTVSHTEDQGRTLLQTLVTTYTITQYLRTQES